MLSDNVKNHSNGPNFNQMATEQSLFAQVVKLWRRDLQFVASD